jgi:acetolactate synthase-1/2/3 large subunit
LRGHLFRQFHAPRINLELPFPNLKMPRRQNPGQQTLEVLERLRTAERPALVIGSQALVNIQDAEPLVSAVRSLGIPTFLAGSARGLLGRHNEIQFRHQRSKALKEADVVIIAGFPFDFRLGYGRSISSKATLIAANLSSRELRKNRKPDIAIQMHAGQFLQDLAAAAGGTLGRWEPWMSALAEREAARDDEIRSQAAEPTDLVNPLDFFVKLEDRMDDNAVLVVDGGDFVATCSYILRPRSPLSWLDPGVFGTLGVGGGFTVGATLCRPDAEVWLIYGDGSSAYSLAEFDTYVRHGLAPIAVIGTDGAWAQIAREQVEILGDDVGTVLNRTNYHTVAEGYGGVGLLCDSPSQIEATIDEAKAIAKTGKPVCINLHIATTDFRKGSISM